VTAVARGVLRRTLVRDVMTTDVVSVAPDTSFDEVTRALLERGIRAVPVIDDGVLVGVVTEADLVRTAEQRDPDRLGEPGWSVHDARTDRPTTAADVMSTPAIYVLQDASVAEAARRMRIRSVGWLPVLDEVGGRVVGVLGRSDVLAVFLRDDAELRAEVVDEVFRHFLHVGPGEVEVGVRDGVVTLRGRLATRSDVELAVALVARLEGVVSVVDELTYGPPPGGSPAGAPGGAPGGDEAARGGTVVVAVDVSASARAAVWWAGDVAAACGARLRLVHAVRPEDGRDSPAAAVLRELCADAERAGVSDVDSVMVTGTPAEVLAAHAVGARLLVLGSAGARSGPGMTGPLARLLADGVDCPLAVVRGASVELPAPRQGPVVVGVDGSVPARAAADLAADLAAGWGASVTLVHSWTELRRDPDGRLHLDGEHRGAQQAAARRVLDAEAARVRQRRPGLSVGTELGEEPALSTLLHQARGARAVVVGHREHTVTGTTQASVLQGLLAFAPCPVIRVR
jgi:CBS domain-containing protein